MTDTPAQHVRKLLMLLESTKVHEAREFQGNRGTADAETTDHTYDEAQSYVKSHYPRTKTYMINRLEPGFRVLTGANGIFAHSRRVESFTAAFDSVVKFLDLKPNAMMSGSEQKSLSLGWSWHTFENAAQGIAILYYEDRGMGQDTVMFAAKNIQQLDKLRETGIAAGIIPDPSELKAQRAAKAAKRTEILNKKGLKVGTQLKTAAWIGEITSISNAGVITVTTSGGRQLKLKPSQISKNMIVAV